MPAIDFSKMDLNVSKIDREWKTLQKHNSYKVRYAYHQKKIWIEQKQINVRKNNYINILNIY